MVIIIRKLRLIERWNYCKIRTQNTSKSLKTTYYKSRSGYRDTR